MAAEVGRVGTDERTFGEWAQVRARPRGRGPALCGSDGAALRLSQATRRRPPSTGTVVPLALLDAGLEDGLSLLDLQLVFGSIKGRHGDRRGPEPKAKRAGCRGAERWPPGPAREDGGCPRGGSHTRGFHSFPQRLCIGEMSGSLPTPHRPKVSRPTSGPAKGDPGKRRDAATPAIRGRNV